MPLSDALAAAKPPVRTQCHVCQIIDRLPVEDRNVLVKALSIEEGQPEYLSSPVIARALQSEGYTVGHNSVQRHRKNHGAV